VPGFFSSIYCLIIGYFSFSFFLFSYIENDEGFVNVRDGALGLSAEDEAIVAAMNAGGGAEERKTLADIIMEKIAEKESRDRGEMLEDGDDGEDEVPQ